MRHSSIALGNDIEFINIENINPLASKCQIKVCYVGDQPNRNHSIITKEVAKEMAQSLPGSPIVGLYNEEVQDFEEHNREIIIKENTIELKDITKPYGFVDLNAKVWFQKFIDDGKDEREYLMTEGYLWTGQYPECERIISQGNNQSMELDEKTLKASWSKNNNEKCKFFIINEAIISKLCILGEDQEPCFEGANITSPKVQFSFDNDFKTQLFSMMKELTEFLQEGGKKVDTEEKVVSLEEEQDIEVEENSKEETEFKKEEDNSDKQNTSKNESKTGEEKCPECGKPLDECTCEEKKEEKKFSLEEIPEYVELQTKYSDLESRYNTLVADLEKANGVIADLTEFKNTQDKKEKQNMINSFYMLSDEDKQEVVDKIEEYSLDEIEAKLSILCVRNKVSFNLEDEVNTQNNPTTYSLNEGLDEDVNIPEWVKAVRAVEKKMN